MVTLLFSPLPLTSQRQYAANNLYYYTSFGFQHYEKAEEARAAADALNGTEYNGNTLKVEVLIFSFLSLFLFLKSYDYHTHVYIDMHQSPTRQASLGFFLPLDRAWTCLII